jgi:cytochrome c oxidase assembly factor CtaG
MWLSLDPGAIIWLMVAEGLYLRAIRILRRRGVEVPQGQKVLWHLGWGLQCVALLSPIATYSSTLLTAHMGEHLLMADLAAPFLLAGLRNPVLFFFLPKDVLVPLARATHLRRFFRFLRKPLVAIPVYTLTLYGWHLSFAFQGALRHDLVHVAQHATFIFTGMLVWWSVIEPKRRELPGALWKIGHIFGARMLGMMLGMSYVLIRVPVYADVYGSGTRHGLKAIEDQQIAGALMVSVDIGIMFLALAVLFWKAGQTHDREEALAAAQGPAAVLRQAERAP